MKLFTASVNTIILFCDFSCKQAILDMKVVFHYKITKCEKMKKDANEKLKSGNLEDHEYIPRCDENGEFMQMQCWGETVECFCVDSNGTEIAGTRKIGRPDCTKGTFQVFPCSYRDLTFQSNHFAMT